MRSLLRMIRALQVRGLERGYPGGIAAYLKNAKALLRSSAAGDNPFEGMRPEVRSMTSMILSRI